MIAAGLCRLFVTRDGSGQAVAAVGFLVHNKAVYYWLAGSRPGPAMTILLSSALPALAATGAEAFDFVGGNTPSIAEFKRRLGAIPITYWAVTTPGRPGLRALRAVKGLARAVVRR